VEYDNDTDSVNLKLCFKVNRSLKDNGGIEMKPASRSGQSTLNTFLSYAVPSTTAMLATSLYIVIEGVILGRGVGAHALAAVNMAFPATLLINAVMIAISVGGATVMSMRLGEGNPETAVNIFMQSISLMAVGAVIFIVPGNIFLRQLCILLGADSALLPDVMIFVRCYLLTSLLFVANTGLNVFVRNDGNPKLSMLSSLIGTIATIVIVYVFVFILHLGIVGAGLAGGFGNIFSLSILSIHFIKKKGVLRFSKPRFYKADMIKIVSLGFPSMLTEAAMAVSSIGLNIVIIRRVGEIGVSAYSIANYLNAFVLLLLMGIAQGIQPIVSYNYGAHNTGIIIRTYRIAVISALTISAAAIAAMLCFGVNIVILFNSESRELVSLSKTVLFWICLAFIPTGINLVNVTYFQSVANARLSSAISLLRGFVFILLGILVLPLIFGNTGIWITLLVGELLTLVITFSVWIMQNRRT
jgi:Na+-driven multidrug efflux pump